MPRVTAAHEHEVRERIVTAALRVFSERGFHGATVADVVRESGLSVGAIYTYFRGKDELLLAACDATSGLGLGELARRLAAGRTTAERLAIAVAFYFDVADGKAEAAGTADVLLQAWAVAEAEPAAREMLVRRREQLVTVGQMLIQEGIAHGELPAWIDVEAVARAYTTLLDGLLLARAELGATYRRADLERQAREVLALMLAAAAAPRPELPEVEPQPFSLLAPRGSLPGS